MTERIGLETVLEDANFAQGLKRYIAGVSTMEGVTESAASKISSSYRNLGSTVLGVAATMGKVLVGGVTALATGLGAAAVTGLKFNSSLEVVQAQLNAFLKDGNAVAKTLDMIRDRASRTPFQFQEMANAAAALIPAAKQSGTELEKLIGFAEILAASNPAQGLEGAAFSLKEALSGDFVSIVSRFNLPRKMLTQLRKEGVPALEAISMAMQSMGLDAELVTNLSQTAIGRLSTIKDKLLTILSSLTQPIFNLISASMGEMITKMDAAKPTIDAVVGAISGLVGSLLAGQDIVQTFQSAIVTAMIGLGYSRTEALNTGLEFGKFAEKVREVYDRVSEFADKIATFAREHAPALQGALMGIAVLLGSAAFTTALFAIGGALVGLASPIALMIALSAGLGAAWATNWGNIQGITQEVIAGVKSLLAGDGQGALTSFQAAWGEAWGRISTAVTNAWANTIQPALAMFWTNISTWFASQDWGQLLTNAVLQLGAFFGFDLQPFLTKLGEVTGYISSLATTVGNFVAANLDPLLASVGGVTGAFAGWAIVPTVTGWVTSLAAGGGVLSGIIGVLSGGFGALASFGIAPVLSLLTTISGLLGINLIPFLKVVAFTVGDILLESFTALGGTLSRLVSPALGTVSGLFGTLWKFISPVVTIIASPLMGALSSLTSSLGLTGSSFGTIIALLGGPVTAVLLAIGALIGFVAVAWARDWGNIREIVANAWDAIKAAVSSAVDVIRPAFDTFMAGLRDGFASFAPLGEQFKQLWVAIEPIVTTVVAVIGAAIAGLLAIVVGVFTGIASAIGPFLNLISGVVSSVIGIFTGLANFVTGFVQTIVALFKGDLQGAADGVRQMGTAIWQILSSSWNGIISLIQNAVSTILALVGGFVDGVIQFAMNLYNTLIGHSIFPDLIKGIIQLFIQLVTMITAPLAQFVMKIVTSFMSLVGKVTAVLVSLWTGIRNWFTTQPWGSLVETVLIPKLVDPLKTLWEKAKAKIVNLYQDFKAFLVGKNWAQIGTEIVAGVKQGISDAINGLVGKAKEMAQAAIDAAKSVLGINSPSTVFTTFGTNVGQGLVNGVVSTYGAIRSAGQGMAGALGGAGDGASPFGGQFSETLDQLISTVRDIAERFGSNVIKDVADLADAGKKMVDLIQPFIEAINYLSTAKFGVNTAVVFAWGANLEVVFNRISEVAWHFASIDNGNLFSKVSSFADTMEKVGVMITQSLASFSQLVHFRELTGLESGTVSFANSIRVIVDTFGRTVMLFSTDMLDSLYTFAKSAEPVFGLVQKATDGIMALEGFSVGDVLPQMSLLDYNVRNLVAMMGATAMTFEADFLTQLQAFAQTAGAVVGIVQTSLASLKALEGFDVGNLILPMSVLAFNINALIGFMGSVARSFEGEFLTHLQTFSQTVGAVNGIIQSSLTTLADIGNFIPALDIEQKANAFASQLFAVINALSVALAAASDEAKLQIESASEMTASINSVLGVVKLGLEALAGIADFSKTPMIRAAAERFGQELVAVAWQLATTFLNAGDEFKRSITLASEMIANIKSVLDVVKVGLDALAALATFEGTPMIRATAERFGQELVAVAWQLANAFNNAGDEFKKSIATASEMIASIKTVLDVVKVGIDALAAINSYLPVTDLKVKLDGFIFQMVALIGALAAGLAGINSRIVAQIGTATLITGSVKEVLAVVKTAVDALAAIAKYVAVDNLKAQLETFVSQTVTLIGSFAAGLANINSRIVAQIAKGADIAKSVKEVLAVVKTAVDALAAIAKYVAVDNLKAQLDNFTAQLVETVISLHTALNDGLSGLEIALTNAGNLSGLAKEVLETVKRGVDSLKAISEFVAIGDLSSRLETFTAQLVATVISLKDALNDGLTGMEGSLATAGNLSGLAKEVLDTVKRGVDSLKALGEYEAVSGLEAKLTSFTQQLVSSVVALKNELIRGLAGMETALETAGSLSGLANGVLESVKRGVDALKALGEYEAVAGLDATLATFAEQFTAAVKSVADTMNGIPAILTQGTIAQAAAVAEAVNSVIGSVKSSIDALNALASGDSPQSMQAMMSKLVNALVIRIPSAATAGYDFGLAFVNGLGQGIGTLSASSLVAAILAILLDALNSIGSNTQLYQSSWSIGERIVQGIADGINQNRDIVQGSILGLTDSLVKLAEVNLGIASPSRVFTGIGMNVGAGMGVGIAQSMRGVSDMMTRNVNALMSPPPSRVYGGGSSSPRVQRPVIVQVEGGSTSNQLTMNTQTADASSVTRGYNWLQTMARR